MAAWTQSIPVIFLSSWHSKVKRSSQLSIVSGYIVGKRLPSLPQFEPSLVGMWSLSQTQPTPGPSSCAPGGHGFTVVIGYIVGMGLPLLPQFEPSLVGA